MVPKALRRAKNRVLGVLSQKIHNLQEIPMGIFGKYGAPAPFYCNQYIYQSLSQTSSFSLLYFLMHFNTLLGKSFTWLEIDNYIVSIPSRYLYFPLSFSLNFLKCV